MRHLMLKIALAAVAIVWQSSIGWVGFSGDAIQQRSTDTCVAFTLKPQRHVSIEIGFKPKQGKWFSPPK